MNLHIYCKSPTWLGYEVRNNVVISTAGTALFNNFFNKIIPQPSGYVYSNGWDFTSSWMLDDGSSKLAFSCQYRPSKTNNINLFINTTDCQDDGFLL